MKLKNKYAMLNPAELKRKITKLQNKLLKLNALKQKVREDLLEKSLEPSSSFEYISTWGIVSAFLYIFMWGNGVYLSPCHLKYKTTLFFDDLKFKSATNLKW